MFINTFMMMVPIILLYKSMEWMLYDRDLSYKRVKVLEKSVTNFMRVMNSLPSNKLFILQLPATSSLSAIQNLLLKMVNVLVN